MTIFNIITCPFPDVWPTGYKVNYYSLEWRRQNTPLLHRIQPNKLDSYKFMPSYLEILLPVEDNGLGLDLSVLNIHFVATQHYRDVFTYSYQISVPIRYILVSNSWCYIKHYDGTLSCKKIVTSYIRRVSTCLLDRRKEMYTQKSFTSRVKQLHWLLPLSLTVLGANVLLTSSMPKSTALDPSSQHLTSLVLHLKDQLFLPMQLPHWVT